MKRTVIKFLHWLAASDLLWKLLKPFSTAGLVLINARLGHEKDKRQTERYHQHFESLTVLHGPFKGLQYPRYDSVASALFPKLLGSYESELHPVLAEMTRGDYSQILDIGCAEGYYAIGLAQRCPASTVVAFDTDEKARALCAEMAELNGVKDRVKVKAECTSELLGNYDFEKKSLIICDCEGFEINLFNSTNIDNLRHCDLIIETHDFMDIGISDALKKLFSTTHELSSIFSVDDIQKAHNHHYPELEGLTLQAKKEILEERRPAIMEWLICRCRSH